MWWIRYRGLGFRRSGSGLGLRGSRLQAQGLGVYGFTGLGFRVGALHALWQLVAGSSF